MIDTNKLLSNRSGGSTTLSRKSVINIGLIREDVIKIDGLLKSRLVLSKVRDGIERQSLERLKRKNREDDLERDDDRDDDDDRRDPDPKPKKGGGLIGFLIGGALAVIGGIAMKFLPTILSIGKFIGKIAKVFTFVVGGAFTAIGSFLSLFNDGSKKLKGLDKDQLGEGYINDVFTNFNGAITNVVLGIIAAAGSAAIVRAFMMKRMMTPDVFFDKMILARRGSKQLTDDELLQFLAKKLKLNPDEFMKPVTTPFTKRKRGRPRKTLLEIMTDIDERNPTKPGQFTGQPVPLNQKERTKKIKIEDVITSPSFKQKAEKLKTARSKVKVSLGFDSAQQILRSDIQTSLDTAEIAADETLYKSRNLPVKERANVNRNVRAQKKFIKKFKNLNNTDSGFKSIGAAGRQSFPPGFQYNIIRPSIFEQGRSALSQTADFLSPSNLKGLLSTRGGIVKVLSNIGGDAFVQTFKQGLKGSIGVIPILGDVFGFLLDYFVFGEPIGRAAFKAIGSFALSSLIGAVGLALGGPVGAFIGGMIGGIGGDILGGIAYDLFFGTDGGVSAKSSATKGAVKGVVTQTFEDGGYVGDEPPTTSFKPLVNSVDKSINLRTTPSYARGGGKVKFIPLPIPIPTKGQSQEEEGQLSMTSNTIETKTFAGLYQR